MPNELKLCPFCGSEAEILWHHGWFGVNCTNCTASVGDDGFDIDMAIEAWEVRDENEFQKRKTN